MPHSDFLNSAPLHPIRARYDSAQVDGTNSRHWQAADALDADSAHSLAVRRRIAYNARYEIGNNGYKLNDLNFLKDYPSVTRVVVAYAASRR
jgi:hypothetical protein